MSGALWTGAQIVKATGGELVGDLPTEVSGVAIDSRTINQGELFFAIKGDNFDGHAFVEKAFQNGASLAVVAKDKLTTLPPEYSYVVVEDTLRAMESLGRAARMRFEGKVIAVTGSVGKTGSKEMLRMGLGATSSVHAPVASFNNHWGVPLTLCRTEAALDFGIYEIGMNAPGEIETLVDMVSPHVALITTVAPVHIEFFESVREIARAKSEIFTGLMPGGIAVLNRDNEHYDFLVEQADGYASQVISFGSHKESNAKLLNADLQASKSIVEADICGTKIKYEMGAPGEHLVLNSLGVLATIYAAGGDVVSAAASFTALQAPKGRGERHQIITKTGDFTLIDESYNANPTSMRAAIGLLGSTAPAGEGRRIAVLGDMRELGDDADQYHADLVEDLLKASPDKVFLCGPHMAALKATLGARVEIHYEADAELLKAPVLAAVSSGDVFMVKGSLGSRMIPIVEALKALGASK